MNLLWKKKEKEKVKNKRERGGRGEREEVDSMVEQWVDWLKECTQKWVHLNQNEQQICKWIFLQFRSETIQEDEKSSQKKRINW